MKQVSIFLLIFLSLFLYNCQQESNYQGVLESKKSARDVEDVIAKAIKKIGGRKENELCKYLPMKSGGYMHHFTLRKMKNKQPQELSS
ncbi:MAG: hypothetical protein NWS63_08395, partial [Saprospiraceae bacterium]|nr:hypothetical protein [Saprospiraceae bacterium]